MFPLLWATSSFQSHNESSKVAQLAKKSTNPVTL
jgi:hypothetical protein